MVVVGIVSDRLRVRKPFMMIGGVGAVAMGLVFAALATHPHTSYGTFVVVIMVMSASRGVAYAPWMAAYTETLEARNPALVATGLAIWGWILRLVAAISFLVVPFVVPSATPVADYGPQASALQARYATQIATLKRIEPATLAELQADPGDRRAVVAAARPDLPAPPGFPGRGRPPTCWPPRGSRPPTARFLATHGREVLAARVAAPRQWQRWWYVCVAGEVAVPPHHLPPGRAVAPFVGPARRRGARPDGHRRIRGAVGLRRVRRGRARLNAPSGSRATGPAPWLGCP